MARAKIVLCVLIALASFGLAQAQPSDLLIYNVWVRPTAPTPKADATPEAPIPGTVTGGYLTIQNTGSGDYHLVGVKDNFAEMSQLHQTTIDSKGVARMQAIDALDIPSGQTVTLADNGYHVMLMNVAHDLYANQAVALTLTFSDSSGSSFDLPVGALVSANPPPADPLLIANAVAQADASDKSALDVSLILDNTGTQGDTLTGAAADFAKAVALMHFSQSGAAPFDSIYVPPQSETVLTPDTAFVLLTGLSQPLPEAFVLTLDFQSGKKLIVAVPVQKAVS